MCVIYIQNNNIILIYYIIILRFLCACYYPILNYHIYDTFIILSLLLGGESNIIHFVIFLKMAVSPFSPDISPKSFEKDRFYLYFSQFQGKKLRGYVWRFQDFCVLLQTEHDK